MIIHGQFYDGIVGKPDLDEALEHYGIKGMKWHKVKAKIKSIANELYKKTKKGKKKEEAARRARYIGRKIADDVDNGRYNLPYEAHNQEERDNAVRFNNWRSRAVAEDFRNTRLTYAPNTMYRNYRALGSTNDDASIRKAYEEQLASNEERKRKKK